LVKLPVAEENFEEKPLMRPVLWLTSPGLTPYPEAVEAMDRHVATIRERGAPEAVWLVEHPAIYTAGTSAKPTDLLLPDRFPVFETGRGGQFTYHGPGQRVAYLMLDLARRGKDVRAFVRTIGRWIIDALAEFGVHAVFREGRTGLWVPRPDKGPLVEDKIAAIGIRVRRWVSFHGVSINVSPDLRHYDGIVACGIRDQGVTSLADLGHNLSMAEVDTALRAAFVRHFGATAETDGAPTINLTSSIVRNRPL
jgi:lipoyl(octanoyl) transferase